MPQSLTTKTCSGRFTPLSALYRPSQFHVATSTTPPPLVDPFPVSPSKRPVRPQAAQPPLISSQGRAATRSAHHNSTTSHGAHQPKRGPIKPLQTCRAISFQALLQIPQKPASRLVGNVGVTMVTKFSTLTMPKSLNKDSGRLPLPPATRKDRLCLACGCWQRCRPGAKFRTCTLRAKKLPRPPSKYR